MAVGLTVTVPPVEESVQESPPPVTVTVVALLAVTVRVEDAPDVMDVGFAVMETVGCCCVELTTVILMSVWLAPPQ